MGGISKLREPGFRRREIDKVSSRRTKADSHELPRKLWLHLSLRPRLLGVPWGPAPPAQATSSSAKRRRAVSVSARISCRRLWHGLLMGARTADLELNSFEKIITSRVSTSPVSV